MGSIEITQHTVKNDVLNDTSQSENLKEVSVDQQSSAEVHMWCVNQHFTLGAMKTGC